MENKAFDDEYTLKKFCIEDMPKLLEERFPYLGFKSIEDEFLLNVYTDEAGMILGAKVKDKDIVAENEKFWTPEDTETALQVFILLIKSDPRLLYHHMKYKMKKIERKLTEKLDKILTMIEYAPGGPVFEEAQASFLSKC